MPLFVEELERGKGGQTERVPSLLSSSTSLLSSFSVSVLRLREWEVFLPIAPHVHCDAIETVEIANGKLFFPFNILNLPALTRT